LVLVVAVVPPLALLVPVPLWPPEGVGVLEQAAQTSAATTSTKATLARTGKG
jgi:hypothetical protein